MGGKGRGCGRGFNQLMQKKFQVTLGGEWSDYSRYEDEQLKKAWLIGHRNARFVSRGQSYLVDFSQMTQKNLESNKSRRIRPPPGLTQPSTPLLPPGPMIVINVPAGAGIIEISNPQDPHGQKITVNVPPGAKPGQKMAVPVPGKGETVEQTAKKQKGWSTGKKVAAGVGVTGLALGGVILGDHLSDGAVGDWIAEAGEDAGEWIEEALDDAGEDIADFFDDLF